MFIFFIDILIFTAGCFGVKILFEKFCSKDNNRYLTYISEHDREYVQQNNDEVPPLYSPPNTLDEPPKYNDINNL